jgi:hypothetical protein
MTIGINGMAHVILTVNRFEVAREFYRKLLPEFGMKPVFGSDKFFYCVGARTAIGIEPRGSSTPSSSGRLPPLYSAVSTWIWTLVPSLFGRW